MVLALGIGVSAPLLWWADAGFDGWTVGFALWQALPFALLILLHKRLRFSHTGTVVTAFVAAGLTVLGYAEIHRDDSSTAALGFIWFPIWLAVLIVIAWLIDFGVRGTVKRLANPS